MQAYIPDHIAVARRGAGKGLLLVLWLHVPPLTAAACGWPPGLRGPAGWLPALAAWLMAALATAIWWRRQSTWRCAKGAWLGFAACLATSVSAGTACLEHGAAAWGVGALAIAAYELAGMAGLCGLVSRNALAAGFAVLLAEQTGLRLVAPDFAPGVRQILAEAAMLLTAIVTSIWLIWQLDRTVSVAEGEKQAAAQAAADMEQALRLAAEAATDLSAQAAEDRMAHEFEQEIGARASQAAQAAQGLRDASTQLNEANEETARRTAAIANSSRDTVASAREVAASVDQLAGSITAITTNVREVSEASFRAMDDATSANDTVQRLADAAVRIGKVVSVINSIARKTNMLALNATIEAARAGEAGLGFAVVANEVKDLAHQTSTATGNIEQEISVIRSEISQAVSAIDGMAQTVAQLGGSTVQAACTIDEHAEIAHSIAASAMRAADGTNLVVTNLDALSEATGRAEAAARVGSHDAELLAEQCAHVESTVRNFVKALLAA